jgi:hypothetical protein
MSTDNFEKRLERLSMRSIPREWRSEILKAARSAQRSQSATRNRQPTSAWRELLWPCPHAWAGLAVVWGMILLFNVVSRDPVQFAKTSKAAPASELFLALKEHRRLLTELIGTPTTFEPAKPFKPQPRSELPRLSVSIQFA